MDVVCALLVLAAPAAAPAGAQALELGPQFRVDAPGHAPYPRFSVVAAVGQDDFVATWFDAALGARGRRLSSQGPRGPEFSPSLIPTDLATIDGSVWAASHYHPFGGPPGIFIQRYTADGDPMTPALQVNETEDENLQPRLSVAADGSFLVAWYSQWCGPLVPPGGDKLPCLGTGVHGRGYLADGTASSGQFDLADLYSNARVIPAADGDFLFMGSEPVGADARGQIYDPSGVPQGPSFALDEGADIARLTSGDFVVVWITESYPREILERRFAPDGTPRGPATAVRDCPTCTLNGVTVRAGSRDDRLIVFFEHVIGTSERHVAAVWVRPTGTVSERAIVDAIGDPVTYESIWLGADPAGGFLVVWTSRDPATQEHSLQARAVRPAVLFVDGFESGDTSAWSHSVP